MESVFRAECRADLERVADHVSRAENVMSLVPADVVMVAYALKQIEDATEKLRQLRIKLFCALNPQAVAAAMRMDELEDSQQD